MKIYVEVDSSGSITACGTTPIGVDSVVVELSTDDWREVMSDLSQFVYKDGSLVKDENTYLRNLKQRKDQELNESCAKHISSGFYHTINGVNYKFSFDVEAQLNFQGARDLLNSGILQSVSWTVKRDGVYERIAIDKQMMSELTMVMLQHKDSNIRKYREQLLPLVEKAQTAEELKSIKWN